MRWMGIIRSICFAVNGPRMSSVSDTLFDIPVRYALTSRLSTEGKVAISLQLFKGQAVAHTQSLGVVEQHHLVDVMFKCRMHLNRLGVQRLSAPEAGRTRLPPAQTLKVRR